MVALDPPSKPNRPELDFIPSGSWSRERRNKTKRHKNHHQTQTSHHCNHHRKPTQAPHEYKKNKQRPINHWTHRQKPSHPLQKSTQTLHPLHKSNQTHQPLHPPHKSMQISTTAGDVELRVGRRLWDRQVRVWELRGRVETDGEKERTNNILYEVRINFFIFYFFQLSAHSHIYNCTLYTYIIIYCSTLFVDSAPLLQMLCIFKWG